MKRFIIVLEESSKEQERTLTEVLKLLNLETWHWLKALWLAVGDVDLDAIKLKDKVKPFIRGAHILVFDVDTREQAGLLPHDSVPWIREIWDAPDEATFQISTKEYSWETEGNKKELPDAT